MLADIVTAHLERVIIFSIFNNTLETLCLFFDYQMQFHLILDIRLQLYCAVPLLIASNLFFLILFFPIFISWRLITLQYCSGFCHTLT